VYENGLLIVTYTYNALGQRTRKGTSNGTTVYHYDLNGQLIAETTSSGVAIRDYIFMGNTPVAQIDIAANDAVYYLHTDHLGTPRRATDENGTVVWAWQGDTFGQAAANEDPANLGSNTTVNLRFPGQYFDTETGLHYNYFRYYDPSTGRYITSDPIGLEGGLNTYMYVGGNPNRWDDQYGLCPWCVVGAVIGGGFNAYTQYRQNGGFDSFDWVSFTSSATMGLLGGGLGTITKGLSATPSIIINSIGSGAIGAGVTAAQNNITGSCNSVSDAAVNGLLAGGLGAGVGAATSKIISAINRNNFNSLPLDIRLFLGSNALYGVPKPVLVPGGVTISNALSNTIANLPIYQNEGN